MTRALQDFTVITIKTRHTLMPHGWLPVPSVASQPKNQAWVVGVGSLASKSSKISM